MNTELERCRRLIFELLLISESRTTDFLELVTGDNLYPLVIDQNNFKIPFPESPMNQREVLFRESCLFTEKEKYLVSQNFALIYPELLPKELYHRMLQKKEGIGKVIKTLHIQSSRHIISRGWRSTDEVINQFGDECEVDFAIEEKIPYKEYTIHFGGSSKPGIHLLEYFNPGILVMGKQSEMKVPDSMALHK